MSTKGEFATQNQTPFKLNTLTFVIACAAILAQRLGVFTGIFVAAMFLSTSKWIMVEWSKTQRHAYQICTIHTTTWFKLKKLCFFSLRWGHCHCNWSAHTKHGTYTYVLCEIEKLFFKEWIAHEFLPLLRHHYQHSFHFYLSACCA